MAEQQHRRVEVASFQPNRKEGWEFLRDLTAAVQESKDKGFERPEWHIENEGYHAGEDDYALILTGVRPETEKESSDRRLSDEREELRQRAMYLKLKDKYEGKKE